MLALVVAGCSRGGDRGNEAATGGPAAGSPGRPEAAPVRGCGYITETEASVVLAQPSRYRRAQSSAQLCTIEPVSGDAFHGTTVSYRVALGNTAQYDFFAAQKSAQPVSGLGDRALWLAAGGTRGNLVVVTDTNVVSLAISDFSGRRDLRKRAEAFAKKVLNRL